MSARKSDKNEWTSCRACGVFFTKSVVSKHLQNCSEQLDSSVELIHNHAFIKDCKLNGFARKTYELSDENIPKFRSDLVVVHPLTLKCCQLVLASSVTLHYNGKSTCATVWSSTSASLDCIYFGASHTMTLSLPEDCIVALTKNTLPSVIANQVELEALDDRSSSSFNDAKDTLLGLIDDTIIIKNDVLACTYYGNEICYRVKECSTDISNSNEIADKLSELKISDSQSINKQFHVLFNITDIVLYKNKISISNKTSTNNKISSVGGLDSQIKQLNEIIKLPFENWLVYESNCLQFPHGVIMHGPSGTGKSMVASMFSDSLNVSCHKISGTDFFSKFYGDSETKLKQVFNDAQKNKPSVLIIDDFHILCPAESTSNDVERRLISTMSVLIDNIPPKEPVVIIAITNSIDNVAVSLRRPGRFDQEVEFSIPNSQQRFQILSKLLELMQHSFVEAEVKELSSITHGYVGADLKALCREASGLAMKRVFETKEEFMLSVHDVKTALCKVGPSAMKEITVDIPKVFWTDVGGQENVKQHLKEAVEWPLKHPEAFKRLGISPPRGLLMYGAPGCSKTLMAKALATESGLNFISIKGPELFNKYLGESEKAVRDVFRKARLAAPSIIFFDEIDALSVQRSSGEGRSGVGDRVLAQILTELDGVESLDDVVIVAATNRPDIIDSALLRPGRIDRLIHVPLPDSQSRREIFEIQFRCIPIANDVNVEELVRLSDGYSGAEICSLCREAAMLALREDLSSELVVLEHFTTIFNHIKPATTQNMIEFYENYACKTTGAF